MWTAPRIEHMALHLHGWNVNHWIIPLVGGLLKDSLTTALGLQQNWKEDTEILNVSFPQPPLKSLIRMVLCFCFVLGPHTAVLRAHIPAKFRRPYAVYKENALSSVQIPRMVHLTRNWSTLKYESPQVVDYLYHSWCCLFLGFGHMDSNVPTIIIS